MKFARFYTIIIKRRTIMRNSILIKNKITSNEKTIKNHLFLLALLAMFFTPSLVNALTINVTSYGVTGNGTTDDSVAFQSALDAAASQNATLSIPADFTIRVTKNLFIYGTCNIDGAGDSSIILCDADMDNDHGREYWISIGISEHKDNSGTQDTFIGTISDLCFKTSSNGKFNRGLFMFNTSGTTIKNCFFDFRSGVSSVNGYFFGATSSGNNNNWEPSGYKSMSDITITENIIVANHRITDSEGFGVCNAEDVIISKNYIYGVGDDPIGCHNIKNLTIEDNFCYSIDGRIFTSNGENVKITNNYCERIAEFGTTWVSGGAMIYAGLEGNNSYPAPNTYEIKDNIIVIPEGISSYTYGIRVLGGRTVEISSNTLFMESSSGGGGIRIEADSAFSGWTDTDSLDTDGIARPRNITIENNKCTGAYPGGIKQTGVSADLIGPFYVKYNSAGSYYWYASAASVENANIIVGGDYSFFNIWLNSIEDPALFMQDDLIDVKPSIYTNGATVTTSKAGRISGYDILLDAVISAGSINIGLYKNDVEISSKTITASGVIAFSGSDINFAVESGDIFQLKAIGSSNLLPASGIDMDIEINGLEATLSACYDFNSDSSTTCFDDSGSLNDGIITGAIRVAGVSGNALNFDGDDYVTVDNHESLDISDNMTISFWINIADYTTGYAGYPIKKTSGSSTANFVCYYFGTTAGVHQGKIGFLANAGGTWKAISPYVTVSQDEWVHVALAYNSTNGGQLYIDGVATGSRNGSGTLTVNTADLLIGKSLKAKLDDLRIYNRELSATEIAYLQSAVNPGALVGHWKFNEGSGSAASDSSPNEFDGTVNGASWSTPGIEDDALSFNGSDYVTVDDNNKLDIYDDLTISFWVNANDYPSGYAGYPIKKYGGTSTANFNCYYFGNAAGTAKGQIGFLANAGGTWQNITARYVLPQDEWVHIAMVYNSIDGGQLYVNGVAYGSTYASGVLALNDADLIIGEGFDGKIDEVRIYNKYLNSYEIKGLYYMHK
jgi:Concanavalin A-like lectin/glucanases superfamily/Pectate lyase superfamily protein